MATPLVGEERTIVNRAWIITTTFATMRPSRSDFVSGHIVNPLRADTAGEATCPYFRKAERIAVAYGFKQAMSRLEAGKVRSVRAAICQLVCQRNYYYLLRGEKPIYPAMQEKISRILERHGASLPVEFDRYEWLYDW